MFDVVIALKQYHTSIITELEAVALPLNRGL